MRAQRPLAGFLAFAVALAAIIGGAAVVDRNTEIKASPVGESEALPTGGIVAGVVIVGTAAAVGTYLSDAPDSDAMNKTDALETHKEVHKSALNAKTSTDQLLTSLDNLLTDSKTIARLEGRHAYIRALNNGSSKSAAEAAAKEAVAEYYVSRQETMLNRWETMVSVIASMRTPVKETPSLSDQEVYGQPDNGNARLHYVNTSTKTGSITLANSSTTQITKLHFNGQGYNGGTDSWYGAESYVTFKNGEFHVHSSSSYQYFSSFYIHAPTSDYSNAIVMNASAWWDRWNEIEQKKNEVQSNLDTFVNLTYDDYTAGRINSSDLIDPYLAAREYSPEGNFETWATRAYSAMGFTPPENYSKVEYMDIVSGSLSYDGVVLTDGSVTLNTSTTYNTSKLNGTEYLMTSDGSIRKLDGKFTIESINTTDGSSVDSVTYRQPIYNTTNISEYETRLDQLENLTAKIEARQAALRTAGGGGLFAIGNPFGGIPGGAAGAAAGVGVFGLFLLMLSALVATPRDPRRFN